MEASIIDVDHVLNICQRRCDDMGISVQWSPYANTAFTDGESITFPVPSVPINAEALDTLYGMVIHECGHHLRPEAFKILKAATPPQHLCALYNIVEDDGMERDRANQWRGDRKALSRMNSLLIRQAAKQWGLQWEIDPKSVEEQEAEPLAALALQQTSRLEWDTDTEPYLTALLKAYPPKARKLYEQLHGEGWVDRFRATKTEHDTWDVAVDLAKRLYPENDEAEYEEIRQAGHSMEGQRDDSDTTMPDPTGQGHGPDAGQRDEGSVPKEAGDQADEGDESLNGEGTCISWKDCVLSEHNEWAADQTGGSLGITWEDRVPSGGVKLMPTHMHNVVDLDKSKASTDRYSWYGGSERFMPKENSRAFANKVRRYIQSLARTRVRRGREHGKLDKGAIVRLGMPPIDGGDWNRKIFYDMTNRTMKDTAIFVLVDWSGSMQGRKMEYAADAAQRLVWCFERVLRVPVALAAFTNRRSRCDIGYIKPFNTRGKTPEAIADNFCKFTSYSSGNNDADSVNWAYHQLLKRKESRKILIVLSDGAPSGSFSGHSDDALRKVTGIIEGDKRVELYGVGITSTAVERYYTNHRVIHSPEETNEVLFRILKEGDNV